MTCGFSSSISPESHSGSANRSPLTAHRYLSGARGVRLALDSYGCILRSGSLHADAVPPTIVPSVLVPYAAARGCNPSSVSDESLDGSVFRLAQVLASVSATIVWTSDSSSHPLHTSMPESKNPHFPSYHTTESTSLEIAVLLLRTISLSRLSHSPAF